MPTTNRDSQINVTWTARINYIQNTTQLGAEDLHKHLFTFPFDTVDKLLLEYTKGLIVFDRQTADENGDEHILTRSSNLEPIIITTNSIC